MGPAEVKDSVDWSSQKLLTYKNVSVWQAASAAVSPSDDHDCRANNTTTWYNSLVHFESYRRNYIFYFSLN